MKIARVSIVVTCPACGASRTHVDVLDNLPACHDALWDLRDWIRGHEDCRPMQAPHAATQEAIRAFGDRLDCGTTRHASGVVGERYR